jgi:hypothetical protein
LENKKKMSETDEETKFVERFKQTYIKDLQDQGFKVHLCAPPGNINRYRRLILRRYYVPGEKTHSGIEVIQYETTKTFIEHYVTGRSGDLYLEVDEENKEDGLKVLTLRVSYLTKDWQRLADFLCLLFLMYLLMTQLSQGLFAKK